jgi:DNA-binding transcriptional ArsR family regulator
MTAVQKAAPTALSEDLERMVARANRVSSYLKAFSHESRLLILCVLAEGEKSVTELENFLQQRQPTVSQQLARLRMDGLVSTRRHGKTIYYRLASDDIRTILGALYTVFCPADATAVAPPDR